MGLASAILPQSSIQAVATALCAFIVYYISLLVRRLYFHPLSNIPGPWYAAASTWYEFYQDVVLGGNFVNEYPVIHAKYGPVVRVSPDRVHVSDPAFFEEVYTSSSKYLKDPSFFQTSGGISEALPAITDPDYHKYRRKVVNNLFSLRAIEQFAPAVLGVVQRALNKADESYAKQKPLDIQRLYTGVTIDTIMQVLADKQLNLIEAEEEEPPFMAVLRTFSENFFIMKHFPILITLSANMPKLLADWLVPGDAQFRGRVNSWISEVANRHSKGLYHGSNGRETVLDLLMKPQEDGRPALRKESLVDETYSFCFAGTHTTSFTISLATYYLLRSPKKLEKVLEELKPVNKNSEGLYEYRDVCNLPYLTAVIKESLRLSSPVPGVLPRLVPEQGVEWGGHYLPPGTPVSIAIRTVHDNPDIFPEPAEFKPERWIETEGLDHWLVVFGKGSRSCIGLNVAWLELYLCLANFFSRYQMTLYNTNEKSTQWTDCGNAMIKSHIKVTVDAIKN